MGVEAIPFISSLNKMKERKTSYRTFHVLVWFGSWESGNYIELDEAKKKKKVIYWMQVSGQLWLRRDILVACWALGRSHEWEAWSQSLVLTVMWGIQTLTSVVTTVPQTNSNIWRQFGSHERKSKLQPRPSCQGQSVGPSRPAVPFPRHI